MNYIDNKNEEIVGLTYYGGMTAANQEYLYKKYKRNYLYNYNDDLLATFAGWFKQTIDLDHDNDTVIDYITSKINANYYFIINSTASSKDKRKVIINIPDNPEVGDIININISIPENNGAGEIKQEFYLIFKAFENYDLRFFYYNDDGISTTSITNTINEDYDISLHVKKDSDSINKILNFVFTWDGSYWNFVMIPKTGEVI